MKILDSIHRQIRKAIDKNSAIDGRYRVILAISLYFGLLYLSNLFTSYYTVWKKLGVPTIVPIFADLRGVLAGFECTRLGYDVLYELPCDPWKREFLAYPRIWMRLTWLGWDQHHAIVLGILMAVSFYVATLILVGRLNNYEAIIYTLILYSPTVMLLIERANVDIIIYVLLFLSLLLSQSLSLAIRTAGYSLLVLSIFLKLFSVFSLSFLLKEKRSIFLFLFPSLLTVTILYLFSITEEINKIKSYFPVNLFYSFGGKILPHFLGIVLSPSHTFSRSRNVFLALILILVILLSIIALFRIAIAVIREFKNWLTFPLPSSSIGNNIESGLSLDSFRIGSSLYLGTFLLSISFDYKLAFLIFTVPQILLWIKRDERLGLSSSFALVGILSTLYLSAFFYEWLFDEIVNWFLWFYYLYTFILTLPRWIKMTSHALLTAK
jgi:hypothetical protein